MIHTFTIITQISQKEYQNFFQHPKVHWIVRKDGCKFSQLDFLMDKGLLLKPLMYKDSKRFFTSYYYFMIVNPCKILKLDGIKTIYHSNQYKDLEYIFNNLIKEYGGLNLPEFCKWKASRIDYTFNLIVGKYVDLYIRLMKKSKKFKFKKNDSTGSHYLKSDAVTLNLYWKEQQLKNKGVVNPEILKMAKGVLRIEIQCMKRKLYTLKRKYKFKDMSITHFIDNEKIAYDVIEYYIKKILGRYSYYKKPSAENIIKKSSKHKKTKDMMCKVINSVYEKDGTVEAAVEEVNNKNILKHFNDLEIDPVTVNRNIKTNAKKRMYSIYELLAIQSEMIITEEEWVEIMAG